LLALGVAAAACDATDPAEAEADATGRERGAGAPATAPGGTPGGDAATQPVADAGAVASGGARCPWGGAVAGSPTVGLAASAHVPGGTTEERRVFDALNAQRKAPLAWDDCLGDLARSHAEDMAARRYYGHGSAGSPRAFMIPDRVRAAGLAAPPSVDENVLMGDLAYFLKGDAASAVGYWMTDGHRVPILGCASVGVGVAKVTAGGTTTAYVTADFSGCP
jgi:uncharacterized protein YkwD